MIGLNSKVYMSSWLEGELEQRKWQVRKYHFVLVSTSSSRNTIGLKPAFEHFQFKFDVCFVQIQILKINYIILLYHLKCNSQSFICCNKNHNKRQRLAVTQCDFSTNFHNIMI